MTAALGLARRGLGTVAPNPSVGCVLVRDGVVVGRGRTGAGGRPHAETQALAMAGDAARGATAYVTLEPCSHHGKTGPCAEALITAGVARVVVAQQDPDPRVSGRGIAMLQRAGIAVTVGVGAAGAATINAGFVSRIERGRPLLAVKVATSLDGRIATARGESQWITGEQARLTGHMLRASHDAIMIGSGTACADNPMLTCRVPGLEDHSPLRVVIDGHLRLPLTSLLVKTARAVPTLIMTADDNHYSRIEAYTEAGAEVYKIPRGEDGKLDLWQCLQILGERGITRLLAETGSHLFAALMRADLIDQLHWFRAPLLLGGDGIAVASSFGVDKLAAAPRFVRQSSVLLSGGDQYDILTRE